MKPVESLFEYFRRINYTGEAIIREVPNCQNRSVRNCDARGNGYRNLPCLDVLKSMLNIQIPQEFNMILENLGD
ncbi:hypothetical protein C7475_11013 [Chitinophaga sp. S165]|nr:hypothetical protein C7475_11013 [Chitinophaga sp. S165]